MTKKKKILVVDDEPATVEMIADFLKASDFEVLVAYDGRQGLDRARAEKPDLIVLDIMMPKLDGFKVCWLLKLDKKYRHIPIIILTAKASPSDRETSYKSGADAYLVKPLDTMRLLAMIRKLLREGE